MHDDKHIVVTSIQDALRVCLACPWTERIRTDTEIDLWYQAEQDPTDGYYDWAMERSLFNFDRFVEG